MGHCMGRRFSVVTIFSILCTGEWMSYSSILLLQKSDIEIILSECTCFTLDVCCVWRLNLALSMQILDTH